MGWSVVFILFCSFIRGACIYEGVFGASFRKILDIPSSIENPLIVVIKSKEEFFFFFMYFRRDNLGQRLRYRLSPYLRTGAIVQTVFLSELNYRTIQASPSWVLLQTLPST